MEILKVINTTVANDSQTIPELDNWREGRVAEGFYFDIAMPVTCANNTTPVIADLRNALDFFLNLTIRYGAVKQFQPLQRVKGSILRNIHRALTMVEVFNDVVGVAAQGTIAAHIWKARLYYGPNRQKARGRRRVVGWTQGKTIEVKNEEGAAITAGAAGLSRTVGVACTLSIVPIYRLGRNHFTHLPHYREVNRAALDATGPEGLHEAIWDENAAFPATAIGKHNLRIGNFEQVVNAEPKFMDYDITRKLDAGGSDPSDEVTVLYMADPFADERELPVGAPYFQMLTQDVASIKARYVYLPTYGEADVKGIVEELATKQNEPLNAQLSEPLDDPEKNGSQSVAPMELVTRSDTRFDTAPGLLASPGGPAAVYVPPAASQVAAAIKSTSGVGAVRAFQKKVALRVPGVTSASGRGLRGTFRGAVRSVFGSQF